MIMDIAEIKRRVDLLKMANNKKYCLIPELAKELKVSKTDLMQFILDNPKLFHTDNQWTYKVMPRSQKVAPNKNLGYIHISEFDYYGVQGYYVSIDKEGDSKYREWLWRNTTSKVKEIQSLGVLHKDTFYTGGFGDSFAHPIDYAISPDGLEKLKQAGWTFNQLNPLSR